ncbi:hypothetical protein DM01DRAFT_1337628 [Hesseltinella vesiculosa]|uniref:VLRF1 domain-containing protein n=1 Tax=Hesseltinella vesiculosa TaxID=101127 RepID=A0A1X2GC33_9FUNG|nr:hypothetical protein DM01DRAFT_1337628 [Hesseltinella vesiculosa]
MKGRKTVHIDPDHLDAHPLNVFKLPNEILMALEHVQDETEASVLQQKQEQLTHDNLERLQLQQLKLENDDADELTLSCRTCQTSFDDRADQRLHFASDWHRYNIKRKLVFDQQPVPLNEFEDMLADLDDSLSGSDDESDDSTNDSDDDKSDDKVKTLVDRQKQALDHAKALDDEVAVLTRHHQHTPKKNSTMIWYTAPSLTTKSFHLGLYRLVLPAATIDVVAALKQVQALTKPSNPRYWSILMMGGGHFAGAVIDIHASTGLIDQQQSRQVSIVTHKTFHRYTTRRKQGGSQSANDSGKGKARSAGAQIRRYNEQALQQDIREVIDQWKKYLDQSECIIVHAPSGNRKMVFGYDGAVLRKDDPRIHGVPFTTRRPTLNELRRVYLDLTTLKVMEVDEQALLAKEELIKQREQMLRDRLEKSRAIDSPSTPSKKETKSSDPVVDKLVSLVNQGKEALLVSYVEEKGSEATQWCKANLSSSRDNDIDERTPTLLHIASSLGHTAVVDVLLRQLMADPTIKNNQGKTAYEMAKDKAVRNVFRRCMHDEPAKWNWMQDARVPSGLSLEQEQEQLAKEAKKKAKEEAKQRQVEEDRLRREQERERLASATITPAKPMSNRLKSGGYVLDPVVRALRDNQVNIANLSPEAKMRLEREKRARAAEERMRRLGSRQTEK